MVILDFFILNGAALAALRLLREVAEAVDLVSDLARDGDQVGRSA